MWWWGPCAGSSCCADVALPRREHAAALYDELVPLMTDGRRRRDTLLDTDEDSDVDAALALRASASGIAVEPGIYRARDVRTHDAVALKVFDKAMLKNQRTRRRLRQEIHVLSLCGEHPNILRLYGVYSSKRTFQIAFELARGGEVMHRIAASSHMPRHPMEPTTTVDLDAAIVPSPPRYRVTEREIARVVASAAAAIQSMHARGIVHGEVRPEHLLYTDVEPDARVVLVDFGRAAAWRDFSFRSRVHCGQFVWHDRHSLKFLPPAVVRRSPASDGVPDWVHAQQVDVWSLGVTMYVLLCGAFPFDGASLDDIRARIVHQKLEFPTRHHRSWRSSHSQGDAPFSDDDGVCLSRAARDLLTKLLEKDPHAAPTIDDVCAHPWLSSDVAADVRWSDSQIGDFSAFAQTYQRAVATSSLRRPTLNDRDAMASSSSSSRLLRDQETQVQTSPPYNVYTVSSRVNHEEDDTFDSDAERPSFVSTDGNVQVNDPEERLSAEAYMRLASAELEALATRETAIASPRRRITNGKPPVQQRKGRALPAVSSGDSKPSVEEERPRQPPPPVVKGDFWPLFSRQRLLFSLKSLSSRSTSSGSKDDER